MFVIIILKMKGEVCMKISLCIFVGMLIFLGNISLAVGECETNVITYRCRNCGAIAEMHGVSSKYANSVRPGNNGCRRSRNGQHDYVRIR